MTSKAARIEVKDFRRVLSQLWEKWHQPVPHRMGLAISGGVDSMALASLCARVKEEGFFPHLNAFIVDHNLRPGSAEEAELVRKRVLRLGLNAEVLTAPKTDREHGLEPYARRIRYRLLGQACASRKINALLVAQHQDDQVETVLWRLTNLYGGIGLAGIRDIARIPECDDLHGVASSGHPRQLRPENIWTNQKGVVGSTMPIEGGGVDILRPFLSYTKQQLIATCKDDNVEWVEDESNQDYKWGDRNIQRQLLTRDVLPAALRRESILAISKRKQMEEERLNKLAQRIKQDLDIKVDTAYGRAVVKIPVRLAELLRQRPDSVELRATLLRDLVKLVGGGSQRGAIVRAAGDFLAETADREVRNIEGGALLRLIGKDEQYYTYQLAQRNAYSQVDSRQGPFEATTVEGTVTWTAWQNWDQRWWIRLGHRSELAGLPAGTTIRPLHKKDSSQFSETNRRRWKAATRSRSIDDSFKYSIPVIASQEDKVMVIPSLYLRLDDSWSLWTNHALEFDSNKYFYDIRYRGG